jgi:hypothetical protein
LPFACCVARAFLIASLDNALTTSASSYRAHGAHG